MNWDALRGRIKGKVILPPAPDFGAARDAMVWNNIKPGRSPDVIVTVKNDDDVAEAVKFAKGNGFEVVVHGGGHTWCGLAVRDGGMTIDLTDLYRSEN